jgi:hypothetical protein
MNMMSRQTWVMMDRLVIVCLNNMTKLLGEPPLRRAAIGSSCSAVAYMSERLPVVTGHLSSSVE